MGETSDAIITLNTVASKLMISPYQPNDQTQRWAISPSAGEVC